MYLCKVGLAFFVICYDCWLVLLEVNEQNLKPHVESVKVI